MRNNLFLPLFAGFCLLVAPFVHAQGTEGRSTTPSGYLGVQPVPLNDGFRETLDTDRQDGVVLVQVVPNSPADRAGLRRLDVLLRVNRMPVTSVEKLSALIRQTSPGTDLTLTILRDGNTIEREVTLGAHPEQAGTPRRERTESTNREKQEVAEQGGVRAFAERLESLDQNRGPAADQTAKELREEMKQFLSDHPPDSGSKKTNGDREKSYQFRELLKELKKKYGDALPEKLVPKTRRQFRQLMKEFREMIKNENLKKFRKELMAYLRYLKEHRLDQLASGDTARRVKDVLDRWNRKFSRSLKQFEKRFDRKMSRYFQRLDRQVQELKKLKERLRSAADGGSESEETKGSETRRPYLGIRAAAHPDGQGLLVRAVAKGSPAERAGLQSGDVILEINGTTQKKIAGFRKVLYRNGPGDRVELRVSRDGWKKVLTVELGARPSQNGDASSPEGDPNDSGKRAGDNTSDRSEIGQPDGAGENLFAGLLSSAAEDLLDGSFSIDRLHAFLDMARWQLNRRQIQMTGEFSVRDGQGRVLLKWSGRQDPVQMINLIEFLLPE